VQQRKEVPSEIIHATQSNVPVRGLRVPDAAAYAGVTHWHIRTAIWTGKLKAYRAGKVIIILREDLDRYLNSLPEVQPLKSSWLAERQAKAGV
jgi:excisionase family DNA binding protein